MSRLRIALYEPRIPQNTGNIARTCGAFNIQLDLIRPLGFSIDDKKLKRAGLDYWPYVSIDFFENIDHYFRSLNGQNRILALSKYGTNNLNDFQFRKGDSLLFGREDLGLPVEVKNKCESIIKIPMYNEANELGQNGVRSLNLATSVGISAFTALHSISPL